MAIIMGRERLGKGVGCVVRSWNPIGPYRRDFRYRRGVGGGCDSCERAHGGFTAVRMGIALYLRFIGGCRRCSLWHGIVVLRGRCAARVFGFRCLIFAFCGICCVRGLIAYQSSFGLYLYTRLPFICLSFLSLGHFIQVKSRTTQKSILYIISLYYRQCGALVGPRRVLIVSFPLPLLCSYLPLTFV